MRQVYTIRRINNFTSFEVVDKFDPMFFHGYRQRNNHIGRTQKNTFPTRQTQKKAFYHLSRYVNYHGLLNMRFLSKGIYDSSVQAENGRF